MRSITHFNVFHRKSGVINNKGGTGGTTSSNNYKKSVLRSTTMGAAESCITGEEESKDAVFEPVAETLCTGTMAGENGITSCSAKTESTFIREQGKQEKQPPEEASEEATTSTITTITKKEDKNPDLHHRSSHRRTWHGSKRSSTATRKDDHHSQGHHEQHHHHRHHFNFTWHGHHHHHKRSSTAPATTGENDDIHQSPRFSRCRLHLHKKETTTTKHHASPPSSHHPSKVVQKVKRGGSRAVHSTSHALGSVFHALGHALEEVFFPRSPLADELAARPIPHAVRGGVMLRNCATKEEHYVKVRSITAAVKELRGRQGLVAAGLEYRLVPCAEHKRVPDGEEEAADDSSSDNDEANIMLHRVDLAAGEVAAETPPSLLSTEVTSSIRSTDTLGNISTVNLTEATNNADGDGADCCVETRLVDGGGGGDCCSPRFCHLCSRRLFDVESNTMITERNRKLFIADGDMYNEIARVCQEHAQDVMREEGGLEWIVVKEDDKGREPIRALVNSGHPLLHRQQQKQQGESEENDGETVPCEQEVLVDRPTVLIATGKGKVRAGIFSREHLMCTGLEVSTALPIVRDAVTRRMNIVIVDPNVHTDAYGFDTLSKSMDYMADYFSGAGGYGDGDGGISEAMPPPPRGRDLYVVSHSASGGQLARYFMDRDPNVYLPNIRAVAFTDSTHNVQWTKNNEKHELHHLLSESNRCVYFRSANVRRDGNQWYLHKAGDKCQVDTFWKHRFGNIPTYWAGTNEHSLTNWYAHDKIWEHFDRYLYDDENNNNNGTASTTTGPAAHSVGADDESGDRRQTIQKEGNAVAYGIV